MDYNANDRRERVLKYFINVPDKTNYNRYYIVMGISFILLILAYLNSNLFGFLFAVGGLIGLWTSVKGFFKRKEQDYDEIKRAYDWVGISVKPYSWYNMTYNDGLRKVEPQATDKEMDDWLYEGLKMILSKSIDGLSIELDDAQNFNKLMLDGPREVNLSKRGYDGKLRFNIHELSIIFLTNHLIATYKCDFDLSTGKINAETTKEFPLKDITNLETTTISWGGTDDQDTENSGIKVMTLYTSGANKFSTWYTFDENNKNSDHIPVTINTRAGKIDMSLSSGQATIRALRTRLKEYKNDM